MLLTPIEATHVYRSLIEANALDSPTFSMSIRRPNGRAVRFVYGERPYNDGPQVLVYETHQTDFGVSILYHEGDPIERHDTQDTFRIAYGIPY